MASRPLDRDEGDDSGSPPTPKERSGLDAALDRAVPVGEAEAFLIGVGGSQSGRVYPLSHNTVFLGRAEEADVYVPDPSVSARHARIINGSQGFEIEDLDSTNGTFVGGQRISRARLQSGDRVTLGRVDFNFLLDRPVEATVALFAPGGVPQNRSATPAHGGALMRLPQPVYPPPRYLPPPSSSSGRDEDEGPSLAEIIGRLIRAYRFIRRYFLMIAGLAVVGSGLGLASLAILPPSPEAICEVKLQPQVKSNPMDPQAGRPSDDDAMQFFVGAERAFTQPELVAITLKNLSGGTPDAYQVGSIVGRLRFEPLPDHIYRATYKDTLFGGGRPAPVEFLTAHLQNYVQTEISKALRVFTAQADFLRGQLKSVEKDMDVISAERTKFREKNADRLPEEADQTQTSRFTLESRRDDLVAQVRRLQGELEATRRALAAEGPLAQTRFQASQSYRESLASINRKLSEAYARGLADGHPEVKELKEEKVRIEGLIAKEMRAETDQNDRKSNAGLQEMQNRVELLQAQLGAARSELADTEGNLGKVRHVVGDLPRVEERVQQLNHTQEATTHLHSQLFEQLKKAELQLSLERVSAESRYEIVTPPQLEKKGRARVLGIRGGIGLFMGLFLAALVIGIREGRRLVSQTLATLDHDAGPAWK